MVDIDWGGLFQQVTSTVAIIGALGFLLTKLFEHMFARDLKKYEAERGFDSGAALERYKSVEAFQAFKRQRLANEVIHWSVPVLAAMEDLERRLALILNLKNQTWPFLDPSRNERKSSWSMTHDYMMSSTLYSLGRYFCWMDLLQEKLNYDFFESYQERRTFFDKMWEPRLPLAWWPWERHQASDKPVEGKDVNKHDDAQMFAFQQRSLGEAMRYIENGEPRCMTYAEFIARRHEAVLASQLEPLKAFLNGIHPESRRWTRLTLLSSRLTESKKHWIEQLKKDMVTAAPLASALEGSVSRRPDRSPAFRLLHLLGIREVREQSSDR